MTGSPLPSPILVTGAGGFIGSHLVQRLVRLGADVCAVYRSRRPELPTAPRSWRLDLADDEAVRRLFVEAQPRIVFHLASHVVGSRSVEMVLPTFKSNLESTINLLVASSMAKVDRVVLAGSLEEPPPGEPLPIPSSPYAAAKWASSGYARMFHALYGTPVVLARLFMVYGPAQHDRSKVIPYVITSLLRGEEPRLSSGLRPVDWVYVDDVVDGLIAAAQAVGQDGTSVDIGAGKVATIRDVAQRLGVLVDPAIPLRFGAIPDRPLEQVRVADAAASLARLGWRAETSLDDGLAATVEWYRQHHSTNSALDPKAGMDAART